MVLITFFHLGADINTFCNKFSFNAFECTQILQESILELREQVTNQAVQLSIQSELLSTHSTQLNDTQVTLSNLQNSLGGEMRNVTFVNATYNLHFPFNFLVPIGFIYVQLPDQPEPHHLWESFTWSDISSQYAGLFFRVLGGGSEQFNVTQAEGYPKITQIQTNSLSPRRFDITIPSSGWSLGISTGAPTVFTTDWALRFFQSNPEVRPRNKAVRVWKRIF